MCFLFSNQNYSIRYYPDAEDVYKGAATVTADEDAQGLEEPIIAPVKTKTFSKLEKEVRKDIYIYIYTRSGGVLMLYMT